jgi:plasmid stabilization system protein ParE
VIEVVLLPKARRDLSEATKYLERRQVGLGERLASEVESALERLAENPSIGPEVSPGVRRLLVNTFPYSVIYRIQPARVLVLAVEHQRRNPRHWQDRL